MKKVQILGPGCPKCRQLAANAEDAAEALGVECKIKKVTDINEIVAFGVMMTPALAVDGEVKVAGEVPTVEELKAFLG